MGRFAIEFWGVQAAVEWDDPRLDEPLLNLLLPIWQHDPNLAPEAVFRVVPDEADGYAVEGPSAGFPEVKRDLIQETVERRLHLYLASQSREAIFVHAGVVRWGDHLIVFPGASHAGKSTLVHALARAGFEYWSDEYAIVDRTGLIYPFPRPLSLRERAGSLRVPADELGWTGQGFPRRAGTVIACSKLAEWRVEELSPGEAMLELLSHTVSARVQPALAMTCLSQAVKGARAFKGTRGDAALAVSHVLSLLQADR